MLATREAERIRSTFDVAKESFLANSFKALGDLNRNRIFHLLCLKGEMSASKIADTLDISHSLASQHLKVLAYAKLISKKKTGSNVFYRLNRDDRFVRKMISTVRQFIKT